MKFSIRFIFVLVALAAISSATFDLVLRQTALYKQESKRDRIAFLILNYISANDDQWPPNWESLKPYYTIHPNDDFDFQQLTEEFKVDFTFDKTTLFEIADDPQRARLFKPIKTTISSDQSEDMNRFTIDIIIEHYQFAKRENLESKQTEIAFIITRYLRDNEDQWPPDWDALQPYHVVHPNMENWAFDELAQEFTVDFSLDAATLRKIANDPKKSSQFQPAKLSITTGSEVSDDFIRVLYQDILRRYRDVPAENRRFP